MLTRRSFLTGAAWSVASLAVVAAHEPRPQQPPARPPAPPKDKPLIDADGREYRVCPQCGNNMYKQGRMWVCEVCGYSYVE